MDNSEEFSVIPAEKLISGAIVVKEDILKVKAKAYAKKILSTINDKIKKAQDRGETEVILDEFSERWLALESMALFKHGKDLVQVKGLDGYVFEVVSYDIMWGFIMKPKSKCDVLF